MPFNIQIIDNAHNTRSLMTGDNGETAVFPDGRAAARAAQVRRNRYRVSAPQFSYRVVKVESDEPESDDWRDRETERFTSGQYDPIPWVAESWFENTPMSKDHFLHMSKDKTGMIAFTESPEKGRDDIQKRLRPGRYLNQFFNLTLDGEQIKYWAGKVSILSGESQEFTLAESPDEIEKVYRNGPRSCMGYGPGNYASDEHPTRMYGAGDLAIAYIERDDSIAARVLVWPEKKIWGAVYGDGGVFSNQLLELLDKAGYECAAGSANRWTGARLLKVRHGDGGGFIAPYLDVGGGMLKDDGEFLTMHPNGNICANSESGTTGPRDLCESCNEGYDASEDGGSVGDESFCQSCYEEYAVHCEDCESTVHRDQSTYIENIGRSVCDSCASEYPTCDSCRETFSPDDINEIAATGESICNECFSENYSMCAVCEEQDKTENLQETHDGDSLCESCNDERKEADEKREREKQSEMVL